MWLNVFRVASITKDHKDDDDQDYLGGGGDLCPPPPGPLLDTPLTVGIIGSAQSQRCSSVMIGVDHSVDQ